MLLGLSLVTLMLARAVAGEEACGDTPVAVRVTWVPASCLGTATFATSSAGWSEAAARQMAVPGDGQTVKVAESPLGLAVIPTMASPVVIPANQTQIA